MKKITQILKGFDVSIREIEKSNLDKLTTNNNKVNLCIDCVQQLRVIIRNNDFSTKKTRDHFF